MWCDLIVTEGPPAALVEFDYVGIKRALRQEFDVAEFVSLLVEYIDKGRADAFALFFGVDDTRELF